MARRTCLQTDSDPHFLLSWESYLMAPVCYCQALKSVSTWSRREWVKWVFLKMWQLGWHDFFMPLSPVMVLAQGRQANEQECCSSVMRPTQLWRRLGKGPSPSPYVKLLVTVPDSHNRTEEIWSLGRVWGHLLQPQSSQTTCKGISCTQRWTLAQDSWH